MYGDGKGYEVEVWVGGLKEGKRMVRNRGKCGVWKKIRECEKEEEIEGEWGEMERWWREEGKVYVGGVELK